MKKKKLKKYYVEVEVVDSVGGEVEAYTKKEALEKFYEESYLDGHVVSYDVEEIKEEEQ